MPEEQLPLDLEAVLECPVVRDVRPLRQVVDRVGQVRIPGRHRRVHPVLDGAVAQASHRAAIGAVHLQLDELAAVDPHRPGGINGGDGPAVEFQQRVRRVIRSNVLPSALFIPPDRDMGSAPCVERLDGAEKILQQVLPVREHVEDDPAALFLAVIPGGPLRGEAVALEYPVAELKPHREHAPEEAIANEPAQLNDARQEQLVLDDAVHDPGRTRGARQLHRAAHGVGDGLLCVHVLAGLDGLAQARLAGGGDLRVEVDIDGRVTKHVVQAGRQAPDAVPLGNLAQPLLAAADQDWLGKDRGAIIEQHPALVANRQQRADQVLPVAHPAGDAVHGNVDGPARHGSPFADSPRSQRAQCPVRAQFWKALSQTRVGWEAGSSRMAGGAGRAADAGAGRTADREARGSVDAVTEAGAAQARRRTAENGGARRRTAENGEARRRPAANGDASRVTLQDVADRAGVSLTTASRVVSAGPRKVGQQLIDRVNVAVAELGYTANLQARAVATGQSSTIGVVVHDIADPYFSSIAAGLIEVAYSRQLLVCLSSTSAGEFRESEYVALMRAQRARAVILIGSRSDDVKVRQGLRVEIDAFRRSGGRVVTIGQDLL